MPQVRRPAAGDVGGRNSMITIRGACVVLVVAACLAITALVTQESQVKADGKPDVRKEDRNHGPVFTTPPGFVVERVAGPPLVERPMMAGFDEVGRLFVCDSSGFNLLQGTSDVLV